ncbi:MAG: hypothetical protein CVU00_12645 [Bacteroidetes bacterium HGW-Bacteroidetes-17]|jgi:hypothetical protein|nr:MAG: hypothetical protein CVU00_12645 [Bacteroidetes bacterium HGW-Bacteroidetes-17]
MNVTSFSDLLYTLKGMFLRKQIIFDFIKTPKSEISTTSFDTVSYHPTLRSVIQNLVHTLKSSFVKSLIKHKNYLYYGIKMDEVASMFSLQIIRIKI